MLFFKCYKFGSWHFSKSCFEYGKRFRPRLSSSIENAKVTGNCCWKLCTLYGRCETLPLGFDGTPATYYRVSNIKASDC